MLEAQSNLQNSGVGGGLVDFHYKFKCNAHLLCIENEI